MWFDTGIVVAYLGILIGIGLRGGKTVKKAGDFTASGGRYGTFVIFASLSASYIGGGYSSGNAAHAFSEGIGMTAALLGFSLATILIGKFLVPGVRRFEGAGSVGGLIGRAYGRAAQVLTGFFSFLCCAGVVGAQMGAMGMVFNVILGIPPKLGILIGCGIILLYSTTGGLQSIIIADMVQFVMLAVGMPLLLVMALARAGGPGAVLEAVPPEYLHPLNGSTAAGFVSLFLTMMFGEALAPPYTQRLLIGKNPEGTARATVLSGLFSIPFFLITGMIGMTAYALHVTTDPAAAMPALVQEVLPRGGDGLHGFHHPVRGRRIPQRRGGGPGVRHGARPPAGDERQGAALVAAGGQSGHRGRSGGGRFHTAGHFQYSHPRLFLLVPADSGPPRRGAAGDPLQRAGVPGGAARGADFLPRMEFPAA